MLVIDFLQILCSLFLYVKDNLTGHAQFIRDVEFKRQPKSPSPIIYLCYTK